MKYLASDEYFYQNADKVQATIFGIDKDREVVALVQDSKKYWKKRDDIKYDVSAGGNVPFPKVYFLSEITRLPKIHFENLSPYSRHLIEVGIEENSNNILVPKFEIEDIANGNGKTLEDTQDAIKKDIEYASEHGVDLQISYENGKFTIPNVSNIDFPIGYAEEMGIAGKENYAKCGVLYQHRSDDDIADDIADALMNNMPKTSMNYHIASVIAEESVDRMHSNEDVEESVKGIINDMSYGCNSGSITEMIYTDDILKFFNEYEDNIRSVINEHFTPNDVPNKEDWAIDGNETKEWMAKSAYEITVAMFDSACEWSKFVLQEIELYEELPKKVKNLEKKDVKGISVVQSQGKSINR